MHRANEETLPLTIAPMPAMKRLPAPPLPAVRIRYADREIKTAVPWFNRPGMSLLAMLVISAFGAFLRFYHLTFPALWNDETLVFWRVCGRYGQMLVPLRTVDGFPPLHYSLYWIVGHPIPTDAYVNQRILGGIVAIIFFGSLATAIITGFVWWMNARARAGKAMPWRAAAISVLVVALAISVYEFLQPAYPPSVQAETPRLWLRLGPFLVILGATVIGWTRKSKTATWPITGFCLALTGLLFYSYAIFSRYLAYIELPNVPMPSAAVFFPAAWSPGQRQIWLSPWLMRAIPAFFGALNVPAIYFLARQMLPRGTSLVATLLTACSAFMLFYSRDGKMYSDSWLFVTLNLGSLLWWFRSGRSTAWLCWVAAGCAMVGLQATAMAIPAITILLALTQRCFQWKRFLLFLVGLLVIYAGPIVYYGKFNQWIDHVTEDGWQRSGLGWVGGFFNGERTGVDLYQYAGSSFLMGWEYPRDDYVEKYAEKPIPDELITGPTTAFNELAVLLALGMLPWPLIWRPRRDLDPPPESAWRVYFWIVGIVLPISYGMYCHSEVGFVSPWRWWYETREALDWIGFTVLGAIAATFVIFNIHHRRWAAVARFFQFWLVTAALFGICVAIYKLWAAPGAAEAFFQGKPWESIWTPRYLGTLWPMVGIGVAVLLMRLPTRPVRTACILFFVAVNLGMFWLRMTLGTEPPIDIQAHDEWLAQDVDGKPSKVHTFDNIAHGGIAVAETALDVHSQKVTAGRYYLLNEVYDSLVSRPGHHSDQPRDLIPGDPQHRPLSPNVFERSLGYFDQAGFGFNLRQDYNWWQFRSDIGSSPQLEKVIVWSRIGPEDDRRANEERVKPKSIRIPRANMDNDFVLQAASAIPNDPMRVNFPPGWKLASENIYTVHNPWDWRTFAYWIRREYVKTPPAPISGKLPGKS